MTIKDKKELVRLLNIYQNEMLDLHFENIKTNKEFEGRKWTKDYYEKIHNGVKSQYNHARIISAVISKQLGDEITVSWMA